MDIREKNQCRPLVRVFFIFTLLINATCSSGSGGGSSEALDADSKQEMSAASELYANFSVLDQGEAPSGVACISMIFKAPGRQ